MAHDRAARVIWLAQDAMETVKLKNAVTERDHTDGTRDAPVTLLEYGNFECIDCGRAFPIIKEVRDVGR